MTRQRNLGPALALTGAGIAAAAIIAGFIIVGGPGDARDKRLDHQRLAAVARLAALSSCAFTVTGTAPQDLETALKTLRETTGVREMDQCSYLDGTRVTSDDRVEYRPIDASHVEICQTFQRAEAEPPLYNDPNYADVIYADGPFGFEELNVKRPNAGRFCYTIALRKLAPPVARPPELPMVAPPEPIP